MRKVFSFIIIFITLSAFSFGSGNFSLKVNRVNAADELGTCEITSYVDGKPSTGSEKNVTKAQCDSYIVKGAGGTSVIWTPNSGGPSSLTTQKDVVDAAGCGALDVGCKFKVALTSFLTYVVWLVMKLVGLTTMLAGGILNYSVKYTIIDMAQKFNAGGGGIGTAINAAWTTVRDIANMSFIFILLYSSILLILGIKTAADTRKLIVNMIIAALLINFSLFFTKVFIDFSNMIALTFYDAIAPGATAPGATVLTAGISNTLMRPLGLSSLLALSENGLIGPAQIVTLGVMGSIMLLIATFIFASIAIILVIRYVILVFLLILSPLAFIADIIPGAKTYFGQWKTALINQSFFPAIYFFLTWITIKIFNTAFTAQGMMSEALTGTLQADGKTLEYNPNSIDTLINFIVVIVFLIATLVVAKKMASKAAPGVDKMVNWATGRAGAATAGLAGAAGRAGFGRLGNKMSQDPDLIKKANDGSVRARLQLAASKKMASSSFDARSTKVGGGISGMLGGGGGTTDGFKQIKEKKGKEKREKADELRGAENQLVVRDNIAAAEETSRINSAIAARTAAGGGGATAAETARLAALRPQVDQLEKSVSNMSDKEIENVVKSNRGLLNNSSFVSRLSSRQVESLNKSDAFSDIEKQQFKDHRFANVTDAMSALAIAPASRTPEQKAAINGLSAAAKGLSAEELEMIDPSLLANPDFISNLRPAQVESMQKSNKFTAAQKNDIRNARLNPIINSLSAGSTAAAQTAVKRMSPKEIAGLIGTSRVGGPNIGIDPQILPIYTPALLRRMALEMNPQDVTTLRDELTRPGSTALPATIAWLNDPLTGGQEFI